MKRAEVVITLGSWSGPSSLHLIGFDSAERAGEEFDRIKELLKRRGDKANDLPRFLEVHGCIDQFTCDFTLICAVSFVDLKKSDEACIGLKDEFPHLGWKGRE
jgi:hypothetical protein